MHAVSHLAASADVTVQDGNGSWPSTSEFLTGLDIVIVGWAVLVLVAYPWARRYLPLVGQYPKALVKATAVMVVAMGVLVLVTAPAATHEHHAAGTSATNTAGGR